MNADLARQLEEMGAEYSAVVGRLRRSREVEPREAFGGRFFTRSLKPGYLAAASVALAALCIVAPRPEKSVPAPGGEYRLAHMHTREAIDEIIRTQNPDGSWRSDFLTKQNAEALRLADGGAARVAYKKAVRAMRMKGVL